MCYFMSQLHRRIHGDISGVFASRKMFNIPGVDTKHEAQPIWVHRKHVSISFHASILLTKFAKQFLRQWLRLESKPMAKKCAPRLECLTQKLQKKIFFCLLVSQVWPDLCFPPRWLTKLETEQIKPRTASTLASRKVSTSPHAPSHYPMLPQSTPSHPSSLKWQSLTPLRSISRGETKHEAQPIWYSKC